MTDSRQRHGGAASQDGDVAFAIDAATIVAVSLGIVFATDRLVLMTIFVPVVVIVRILARIRVFGRDRLAAEITFFAACTLLGGFNDWNSVVRHAIYSYDAPHFFPAFSTIPIWMLLYWGLILRFLATLSSWERLSPPEHPSDRVRLPGRTIHSPVAKVMLQLLIVLATRQVIYRTFEDPLLSWVPFAIAVVVYVAIFEITRHDRMLIALFALGGPLIEVLYIQVGHLHHYHLGWLGGVPVWIAIWWVLIVLIWKDLSLRARIALGHARQSPSRNLELESSGRCSPGGSVGDRALGNS